MSRLVDPTVCPDCRAHARRHGDLHRLRAARARARWPTQLWSAMVAADRSSSSCAGPRPAWRPRTAVARPGAATACRAYPADAGARHPPSPQRRLPAASVPVVLLVTRRAVPARRRRRVRRRRPGACSGLTGRTLVLLGHHRVCSRASPSSSPARTCAALPRRFWLVVAGMLTVDLLGGRVGRAGRARRPVVARHERSGRRCPARDGRRRRTLGAEPARRPPVRRAGRRAHRRARGRVDQRLGGREPRGRHRGRRPGARRWLRRSCGVRSLPVARRRWWRWPRCRGWCSLDRRRTRATSSTRAGDWWASSAAGRLLVAAVFAAAVACRFAAFPTAARSVARGPGAAAADDPGQRPGRAPATPTRDLLVACAHPRRGRAGGPAWHPVVWARGAAVLTALGVLGSASRCWSSPGCALEYLPLDGTAAARPDDDHPGRGPGALDLRRGRARARGGARLPAPVRPGGARRPPARVPSGRSPPRSLALGALGWCSRSSRRCGAGCSAGRGRHRRRRAVLRGGPGQPARQRGGQRWPPPTSRVLTLVAAAASHLLLGRSWRPRPALALRGRLRPPRAGAGRAALGGDPRARWRAHGGYALVV